MERGECRGARGILLCPYLGSRFDRSPLSPYTPFHENEGSPNHFGEMPEWPNGADLKSDGARAHGGSTPSLPVVVLLRASRCIRGGAGEAERARLLSEYTRKCIEGSNPSLPAYRTFSIKCGVCNKKTLLHSGVFFISKVHVLWIHQSPLIQWQRPWSRFPIYFLVEPHKNMGKMPFFDGNSSSLSFPF